MVNRDSSLARARNVAAGAVHPIIRCPFNRVDLDFNSLEDRIPFVAEPGRGSDALGSDVAWVNEANQSRVR